MLIFLASPPTRGRCHETSFQRGGVRRPRAWGNVPHGTRAAPGLRPGPLPSPCQELADGGPLQGLPEARSVSWPDGPKRAKGGRQHQADRGQSAARRRKENAAMARRKAPRAGDGTCPQGRLRRSARRPPRILRGSLPPGPLVRGQQKAPLEAGRRRACPGPRKKYGRWRMAVSYPSPERGRVRREAPGVELANNPPTRSLATLPASGEGLERALAV